MSKIALEGNASGTGTFTIASPNSNSNYTLTLPTETGTVLTNSGNQTGVFSALTVNSNNISADNSLGFRNRIINGDMRIDQRNAGASVTPTTLFSQYTLDRWTFNGSQASKASVQQNAASVTPPAGFINYLGITSLSAYSVVASDFFALNQYVEGLNIADLDFGKSTAKTVTLSFWVRSSLTGTFGGNLSNSANNRNYVFSYTINSANTWEQKSVTITGDTTGTWLTTNGTGFQLGFCIGSGSNFTDTAGAWYGTARYAPTGQVSVVGTNGATFYITGVQIEVGSVATPFERRPYGTELALCQRYYETNIRGGELQEQRSAAVNASGVVLGKVPFQVTKRATPTVTYSNASANAVGFTPAACIRGSAYYLGMIQNAGGANFALDVTVSYDWTASAEL